MSRRLNDSPLDWHATTAELTPRRFILVRLAVDSRIEVQSEVDNELGGSGRGREVEDVRVGGRLPIRRGDRGGRMTRVVDVNEAKTSDEDVRMGDFNV